MRMFRKVFVCIVAFAMVLNVGDFGALAATLTLPTSTKTIEEQAFKGDTSIDEVVLPEGIESIGAEAFADSSLTQINLPESIASIADDAFDGPDKVTVTAAKDSYAYGWAVGHDNIALTGTCGTDVNWTLYRGTLTISGTGAMKNYTASPFPTEHVKKIVIEDGVTAIGQYAFYGCSSATSVTIPSSVTSIKSHSFDGCSNLTRVVIPNGVTSLGEFAFGNCTNLVSATVPDSVTSTGNAVFYDCFALSDVTIPSGLTTIKSSFFSGCRALESITIPNSVTAIESSAFYFCISLASITIPDSVTRIRRRAFGECESLTSVTIPDGVIDYGEEIFYNDNNIEYLRIGSDVGMTFEGHTSLETVVIGGGMTAIPERMFYGCANLSSVTIPESVTSIGTEAFGGCSALEEVNVVEGSYAYNYCIDQGLIVSPAEELAETLGLVFADIADAAGMSEDELRHLTNDELSELVHQESDWTYINGFDEDGNEGVHLLRYTGNSSYVNLSIGENRWNKQILSIAGNAFSGCSALKNIKLGGQDDHIDSLKDYAFANCSGLRKITFCSIGSIGNDIFEDDQIWDILAVNESTAYIWCINNGYEDALVKTKDFSYSSYGVNIDEFNVLEKYNGNSTTVHIPYSSNTYNPGNWYTIHEISDNVFTDSMKSKVKKVIIPYSWTDIWTEFLRYCTSLTHLYIPATVTSIRDYAFENAAEGFSIYGEPGSYAETYALQHGLPFNGVPAPFVGVTSVNLNRTSLEMETGSSIQLTASISPQDATNKKLIWMSSNNAIAEVDEGRVTAVSPGRVTITAIANNGLTATCTVSVFASVKLYARTCREIWHQDPEEGPTYAEMEILPVGILPTGITDYDVGVGGDYEISADSSSAAEIEASAGKVHLTVYALNETPKADDFTQIDRRIGDIFIDRDMTANEWRTQLVSNSMMFNAEDLAESWCLKIMVGVYADEADTEPCAWKFYGVRIHDSNHIYRPVVPVESVQFSNRYYESLSETRVVTATVEPAAAVDSVMFYNSEDYVEGKPGIVGTEREIENGIIYVTVRVRIEADISATNRAGNEIYGMCTVSYEYPYRE